MKRLLVSNFRSYMVIVICNEFFNIELELIVQLKFVCVLEELQSRNVSIYYLFFDLVGKLQNRENKIGGVGLLFIICNDFMWKGNLNICLMIMILC